MHLRVRCAHDGVRLSLRGEPELVSDVDVLRAMLSSMVLWLRATVEAWPHDGHETHLSTCTVVRECTKHVYYPCPSLGSSNSLGQLQGFNWRRGALFRAPQARL